MTPHYDRSRILSLLCTILLLGMLGYDWTMYSQIYAANAALQKSVLSLQKTTNLLDAQLALKLNDNQSLAQSLLSEQTRNGQFADEIGQLSGTVGTLQKLAQTDPQLLEKYSKVFFLSENYAPAQLSVINSQYLYDKNRTELVLSGVQPYLEGMLASAAQAGVPLQVVSAYRSFYEQASLKLGYKVTYGAGTANQFSADQGYSEHQLGTAMDFTVKGLTNPLAQFASSTGYAWLTQNAYRYGFILSYPPGNQYYVFEPWHWRFVGVQLATTLHNQNQYFYNMTQRDIDQYLIDFFN